MVKMIKHIIQYIINNNDSNFDLLLEINKKQDKIIELINRL